MEQIRSQILLESGETLLGIYKTRKNTDTWDSSSEGENGALSLTSHRLILFKEKGVFSKSYELFNTVYLWDIFSVSTGGRIMKHIVVNGLKFFPIGTDINALADLIRTNSQKAKIQHPSSVPSIPPMPQNIHQIVNVNIPPTPSPPSSAPVQIRSTKGFIFCTQCGFQNEADANFCKKCGASII